VRILAIAADKRGEFLPDIPTFKESGIEGVTENDWFGLMVRSDTPAPIVAKLRKVFAEVMKTPEMQAQLKSNALSSYEGSIDDFPAAMAKELQAKREEMKRLGIEPQ
jgi:tripartite-type tricarboxylate transporter receptor subunit TctC